MTAQRPQNFTLSVVIPCFNEESVIDTTYARIVEVLGTGRFQLQIVFVNDGSRDRTAEILAAIAASDRRVKVLTFSRNFGHQAAVSAGLANAGGDATVVMDADLQDPPEIVLAMIDRWREGFDVVYGIRTNRKEAIWKRACYSLFYRIFKVLASIDAPLDAGDFSLIDRRVLDEVNRLPEKNRIFRGLRAWVGFRQTGISYKRDRRAAGETKYPFLRLVKLAADGIFNFSTVPLTLVFYGGLSMAFLSFLGLIAIFVLHIFHTSIFGYRISDVQGLASTILTILTIGGIQLVSIGILGEYIGRIYEEIKARPSYIVSSEAADSAAGQVNASSAQAEL